MLIGNYSVLAKHPGRDTGGGAIGLGMNRGDFNKTSQMRGVFTNAKRERPSGIPDGYRPPYGWMLPLKNGGMAAHTTIRASGTISASNLAGGLNAVAALTGTGDITNANLGLIVSLVASLAGTGNLTAANLNAAAALAASLTGAGDLTAANIGALANLVAGLLGLGDVTGTMRADGHMAADITVTGDLLTSANVAASVWSALATANDDPGTMGEKVNNAASAGDPWGTAVPGSYVAGTAGYRVGNLNAEIWDEPVASHTTTGTFGALQQKLLTVAKFLGLK